MKGEFKKEGNLPCWHVSPVNPALQEQMNRFHPS